MESRESELETLHFEVDLLRTRMEASIARRNDLEELLIEVCRTMIAERELRIDELEQTPTS
jgi:hypothetical protein